MELLLVQHQHNTDMANRYTITPICTCSTSTVLSAAKIRLNVHTFTARTRGELAQLIKLGRKDLQTGENFFETKVAYLFHALLVLTCR